MRPAPQLYLAFAAGTILIYVARMYGWTSPQHLCLAGLVLCEPMLLVWVGSFLVGRPWVRKEQTFPIQGLTIRSFAVLLAFPGIGAMVQEAQENNLLLEWIAILITAAGVGFVLGAWRFFPDRFRRYGIFW